MFVVFFSGFLCFQGIFVIIFGLFFVCFCANCSFFDEFFVFFQPIQGSSNKFSARESSFRGGFLCLFMLFCVFIFFVFSGFFGIFSCFFMVVAVIVVVEAVVMVMIVVIVLIIVVIVEGGGSSEEAQKADLRLLVA